MIDEKTLFEFRKWAVAYGGYSEVTAKKDARNIRRISRDIDVMNISEKMLYDFVDLELKRGKGPGAINSEMRSMIAWKKFRGLDIKVPRLRKPPSPDPWFPTDDEVRTILKSVERVEDPSTMWRDRILMELLFFTGARASEVLRITMDDVRDEGVFIRSSKGEKPRFVPLPQEVIDHVRKYVENYRISSDPKALLTTKEGRMTYNYLRSRVSLIGKRAGVPRMHPHAARHWFATSLLKAGTDIRVIQEVLGHADLSSTQVYTHLAKTDIGRLVRPISSELFRKSTEPGEVQIPLGTVRDSDGTAEIPEFCGGIMEVVP